MELDVVAGPELNGSDHEVERRDAEHCENEDRPPTHHLHHETATSGRAVTLVWRRGRLLVASTFEDVAA